VLPDLDPKNYYTSGDSHEANKAKAIQLAKDLGADWTSNGFKAYHTVLHMAVNAFGSGFTLSASGQDVSKTSLPDCFAELITLSPHFKKAWTE